MTVINGDYDYIHYGVIILDQILLWVSNAVFLTPNK